MTNYLGLIQQEEGIYGIIFPDLPGCVSSGRTTDEAYKNGVEALALHLDGMQQDHEPIPVPRDLTAIQVAHEDWYSLQDAIVVLVPYVSHQDKYVRVNVTLPQSLLGKIDRITKNRSALLTKAAENYLAEQKVI